MGRVALHGVTKTFGDVTAVRGLDLDVPDGELLVLLGPSGCGKSTVLRLVAGLEDPTTGSITVGERVVDDVEAKDRDIAMVFQSYALYPHLTVRRNLEVPLRTRKVSRSERRRRVDDAMALLGLQALADRKPGALSGGQRQRVALARAIVRQPQAFLMDEPLSNLDATLRVQTRAELIALHRRFGVTVVYVTHDQVEAMTMGQRIAILAGGELQQVGRPEDVYARPANRFVAGFLGSPPMNLLLGGLVVGDGGAEVDLAGIRLPLRPALARAAAAADLADVVVGVRPEDIRLGADLPATVGLVERLGNEHHVHARLADEQAIVLRTGADKVHEPGDVLTLGFDAAAVHLFDPGTGRRLVPDDDPVPPSPETGPPTIAAEPAAPAGRRRRWSKAAREAGWAYGLILPSLVILTTFVFYPFAETVWRGFYRSNPMGTDRTWAGVEQYADVLRSDDFRSSIQTTVAFAVLTVPVAMVLGVVLAMLAHQRLRGMAVFRTIFASTIATSVAVASVMFLTLLNPQIGLVPWLLGRTGTATSPLTDPDWALVAVAAVTVWQNLGATFVVLLAGLQAVPDELQEAALVDGASRWRRFREVTMPMLSPTLLFVFVVLSINAFQSFGQIDLLTQGGPLGRTNVLVYAVYTEAFKNFNDGKAAVMAVALFVIVLALTIVQLRFLERRVSYER